MKKNSRHFSPFARFIATVLSLASGLGTYGVLAMPAVVVVQPAIAAPAPMPAPASTVPAPAPTVGAGLPASGTTTGVAEQPLNIPPPIPPDITLMLDDSGSMAWSVMPDYDYLSDNSLNGERNYTVNGVYYNPNTEYVLPPKADSTDSSPDLYSNNAVANFPNAYVDPVGGDTSTQNVTKATGDDGNNGFRFYDSKKYGCNRYGDNCSRAYAFAFTGANGQIYHIALDAATCTNGGFSNCVVATDTSGTAAPAGVSAGQNVMNWYSYYSTRIKMTKTGLMRAFLGLNGNFRVGFGSINGNNVGGLPSLQFAFSSEYNSNNAIAEVQPFGNGSSGTQKANFWSWIAGENAFNGTPLRQALAAVGQYYQTSQPWTWMSSDPGYVANINASAIACRQAYTILTTDGFWNGSYSSSTTLHASDTNGPAFTPPAGSKYTGYTPTDPFQGGDAVGVDKYGNPTSTPTPSLADVATYYWDHDLQSGIADNVVPNTQDPAYWQHMVTFTVGLGFVPANITGTGPAPSNDNPPTALDIANWANDGGGSGSKYAITGFAWPTPSGGGGNGGSINNISDLEHAGINGRGGFFSATNPETFVNGIETALQRATERVGTGASLGANSTKLDTGTYVYQAEYFTGSWKGDLLAITLDPATGEPTTTKWAAGAELLSDWGQVSPTKATVVTYPTRNIWTWSYSGGGAGQAAAFQNNAGAPPALSTTQLNALGSSSAAQADMINYLRGDNTNEQANGGTFRNRTTALGDIVDSAPVYDGAPDATEFNGESFYGLAFVADPTDPTKTTSPFYTWTAAQASRAGLIYVAANDGMLHIFDAATGKEVFAYLPGALMVNSIDPSTGASEPLTNLSNPSYGSASVPHQDYNDGQVTVADAYIQVGTETSPSWHTILVGTTGRGPARAVYAIDVTDPTNITPLWERYAGDGSTLDSNSGYIGEMTGKPIIAQTYSDSSSSTWSVLMGNGYNSPNGQAALLQFNLATGQLHVHKTDTTTGNGLAGVYTWMSNSSSGVTDLAYAGDLEGHVWQFNLNKTTCSGNGNNQTCTTTATPDSAGASIFTAKDANGNVQPITSQLTGAENPTDSNLWLFFGTGKYLATSDVSSTSVQTWYGIIVTQGSNQLAALANGRSALVERQIIAEQAAAGNTLAARAVTPMPSTPDITCGKKTCIAGWYMDLVSPKATSVDNNGNVTVLTTTAQGERMVYPNALQGGLLIGTTVIPQPSDQSVDPCSPKGDGWIMALDPFTGTNPPQNFFDTNGDNQVGGGDSITVGGKQVAAAGVAFGAIPNAPIFVGGSAEISLGNGTIRHVKTGSGTGTYQRVSWRELVNP